jgi:hypothetical protein
MKKMTLLAVAALFGAGIVCAAITANDLTPQAIRTASAALPKNQRQDYARQIIEAVAAQPKDEAAKTQDLTTTARALIAGARKGGALSVIAEIYNTTPITNLQGVADLLAANNFDQKLNGMTDTQFDTFATKLIKSASEYIIATGTDSPTLRISILAATFTKASNNAQRTRDAVMQALPESMQAAAKAYITASEQNNANMLAAAAGVDVIEATPADPDADKVVKPEPKAKAAPDEVPADEKPANEPADNVDTTTKSVETPAEVSPKAPAEEIAAEEPAMNTTEPTTPAVEPAAELAAKVVTEDPAASDGDAKVPLLARMSNDIQGISLDAMLISVYEWDAIDPETRLDDPVIGTLPGLGPTYVIPGNAAANTPFVPETPSLLPPSPAYGNQRTF